MKSEESLKAARERAARGYAQPGDPRFVRKAIEDELRELQRQAMEAMLRQLCAVEDIDLDGADKRAIDALLDGPAPEGR